jgi:acyl carrier protein
MQQHDIGHDVEATLARIVEDIAKVDPAKVTRDKRLRDDLGIDSLSLIDVAVAAEDAFGVPIPDEDLERLHTVGDVADHVRRARVRA